MSGTGLLNDIEILDEDGDALTLAESRITGARAVLIETQTRCDGDIEAGVCVRFDEERVRKLVAWGQAWLDAPRLAARAAAEVVAEDDGVRLLKTTAGEWGVGATEEVNDKNVEAIAWCDGGEAAARKLFDDMLDRVGCDGCEKSIHLDDATDHGDGYYCETCADEAREEFKRTRFRCVDASCGWTGMGPDLGRCDDDMECPRCCGEVAEVGVEPAAEPTP